MSQNSSPNSRYPSLDLTLAFLVFILCIIMAIFMGPSPLATDIVAGY